MNNFSFLRIFGLPIVAMLLGCGCFAQSAPAGNTPASLLIEPGDLLEISVYDNPDLSQEVRVEQSGQVTLALLGPTKLAGLSAQQAGNTISSALVARHQLLNAQVTVLIKEFATQGVSVTGEVQHPGVYPILTERNVLDVISLAGGFTAMADMRVLIKHRATGETVTAQVHGDYAQADIDQNVQVDPGDLVVVPRAGIVYVLGDVRNPGWFIMQDNGSINLGQAMAEAGGPNPTAAMDHAVLLHKTGTTYTTEKVRAGEMIKGRVPEISLGPNDILFIPGNKFKYLAGNASGMISAATGAAVYHGIP